MFYRIIPGEGSDFFHSRSPYLYFQVGYYLANIAVQVMGDIINGVEVVAFINCGGF
jgi:hypothetical protein